MYQHMFTSFQLFKVLNNNVKENLTLLLFYTACLLNLCGDGTCESHGFFDFTCQCNEGAANLLKNPKLPCFQKCKLLFLSFLSFSFLLSLIYLLIFYFFGSWSICLSVYICWLLLLLLLDINFDIVSVKHFIFSIN